jgi:glycosyltransferase involved in cell wall biosynthesis
LRAFAALREEIPSARLDIAGGHPRVSAPGVVPHGTYDLGDSEGRARAISLFEAATVFVMPSRIEPFGIVHVEAASASLPSIGTTKGGVRDSIGPGGLLVDPGDEVGLVAAMRRFSDPETARVFGERALEHSKKNSWEAVADRVAGVLGPLRGAGRP